MLQYEKRIVTYGKDGRMLIAVFADPQYAILSTLLTSEVPLFYDDIIDCLNTVLAAVIPESCEMIEKWAFRNCTELERVFVPANCEIGEDAFAGCT